MQNVGSAFTLPFKSPGWFGTFALMGLIFLVPVIGWINLVGWELTTLDHYRQGRTDLPKPGFSYISRGVNVFVVLLVWALPVILVFVVGTVIFVFAIAAAGTTASATGSSDVSGAAGGGVAAGIVIFYLALFVGIILALIVQVFQPAIIIATERGGIRGGLSLSNVLGIARQSWGNLLISALLFYAAGFLAGLGLYACYVGFIFTVAYGPAVQAGVLRFYEHSLESAPQAPPQAAPA
jgi:hypothetical protein